METETKQKPILIRLPPEVANRLRSTVPARRRNTFMTKLVIDALAVYDKKLEKIAAEVTADELTNPELQSELKDWDTLVGDGINDEDYETEPNAK